MRRVTVKMAQRDSATKSMDNINRKMMHMKQEKENLNDKVETLDAKVKSLEEVIEARDEEIMKLTRRLEQITEDLDVSTRNLDQANKELAEYEKLVREAELEVSALQRQCSGKEEALDTTEERILLAQEKFAEASEAREDSDRGRKVLESRCALDAERIKKLEQQLSEAQMIARTLTRNTTKCPRSCLPSRLRPSGPTIVFPRPGENHGAHRGVQGRRRQHEVSGSLRSRRFGQGGIFRGNHPRSYPKTQGRRNPRQRG